MNYANRLRQFGLSPELTQMAGFAALLIACLGLCALNYSSYYALNAYGLSCATFIVFMLFGMIPDNWQQSINEQQSSSLQHQLNYANYTSTLTGKVLLAKMSSGATGQDGSAGRGLIFELFYFVLLFTLSVLLLSAFVLAQYFRRQDLEELNQEFDQDDRQQVHAQTSIDDAYCDTTNCTCDQGTLLGASSRPGATMNCTSSNTATASGGGGGGGGRQRFMQQNHGFSGGQAGGGQLDHRLAMYASRARDYHRESSAAAMEPIGASESLIRRRQPIAVIMRDDTNDRHWIDGSNAGLRTISGRDNRAQVNSLRGNLSSRSLVSLSANDVINKSSGQDRNSNEDSDDDDGRYNNNSGNDASLEAFPRQQQQQQQKQQQQQPLKHLNNQLLPPLIHRGFYYTTMKDCYLDDQHQQQPQQRHLNEPGELLDTSIKSDRSNSVALNQDVCNNNNNGCLPVSDEMARRNTITAIRHDRLQNKASGQYATNARQHLPNQRLSSAIATATATTTTSIDNRSCRCDLSAPMPDVECAIAPKLASKLNLNNNNNNCSSDNNNDNYNSKQHQLDAYYNNNCQYYNTMPSKLNLSSVYAIRQSASGRRLAAPKQKRSKPSGGSSVMAMTAAAAAALLGGVASSNLLGDGGGGGGFGTGGGSGGGGSMFDADMDDGLQADVMGDCGLEMASNLDQAAQAGAEMDLFEQQHNAPAAADGRSGLEAVGYYDTLAQGGVGTLQLQSNQNFARYLNDRPVIDFGPLMEFNKRQM